MKRIARLLVLPAVAAAVLLPAGAASARPVPDQVIQPGDCGPGLSWTTYNVDLGRNQTVCLSEPKRALHQAKTLRKEADHWWNPFSWFA